MEEMRARTHLGLPWRTRCFDGTAQRGRAARHCFLSRPSAEGKRKTRYWGPEMGSWEGAGLIFESEQLRLGALVFTLAGWGWGPERTGGQGWWEGSGASWKLGSRGRPGRAPRKPVGAGARARRRRALTSSPPSAHRLSPGCRYDSDPQLRLGFCGQRGLWTPLGIRLPGLLRGSRGGGSAAPTAPPPLTAGANRSRGCRARALPGARALTPPAGPRRAGVPGPRASLV